MTMEVLKDLELKGKMREQTWKRQLKKSCRELEPKWCLNSK